MALFKILQGNAENLAKQQIHEGYCYVTIDEKKFYVDLKNERICLNAAAADKLKTERSIQIVGGAIAQAGSSTKFDGSKDINLALGTIYASWLSWGGRVISGDISPLDAALSYDHSANRLQFAKPAGITVEYSTDGGVTWLDYGLTDSQKINFVSGINQPLYYGKHSNGADRTINDQLRITINASECGLYTNLKTVLINGSTGGQTGTQVKIESAKRGSETKFTQVAGPYNWSGWSGWNSIPINIGAFGGGSSQTSNTGALRFTFTFTGLNANYTQTPVIINMMMFGTTHWNAPSNMSTHGHIYNWDASQNAIFPAGISAHSATITQTAGFTYSGIEAASVNADRTIWFSDSSAIGRPVYNNNFKYNPSTNTLTVGSIAGSAAKVANALKINNKTFDGSAAVDVGTIGIGYGGTGATNAPMAIHNIMRRSMPTSKDLNDCIELGTYTWGGNSELNSPVSSGGYGTIVTLTSAGTEWNKSNNWVWQLACSTEGSNSFYVRQAVNAGAFTNWNKLLTSSNYTNYTVKKDGTGATGDWNINAATASKFNTAREIKLIGNVTGSASSDGGSGWSITTTIPESTVTNAMLAGSIANSKLVNSAITVAGNNISLGDSISAATLRESLGLSNAMHFVGIATVAITDGSTTNPSIDGYTTKQKGDVIIDKDSAYEYVWTGDKWERLGGDSSYKTVQSAVVDPTASGNSSTFIKTISQNENGVITATKATIANHVIQVNGIAAGTYNGGAAVTLNLKNGNGITVTNSSGAITFAHSNSVTAKTAYGSTATTASANGGTIVVTDIKYDAQGHITGSTDRTITLSQTTYTMAGLMGSTAKGSSTVPVYWTGTAWATIASYSGKASTAGTADKVAKSLLINGKSFDGSAATDVGTLGISYGGTGASDLAGAQKNLIKTQSITEDTDILTLNNGMYHFEGATTAEKNWPYAGPSQRCEVFVGGNRNGDNGYPYIIVIEQYNGLMYMNNFYWNSWRGWHQIFTSDNAVVTTNKIETRNATQSSGWTKMWTDDEGGNIEIGSPSGKPFQMDVYDDTSWRLYAYDDDGTLHSLSFNRTNGAVYADAVYGAVWNDYAEFRTSAEKVIPGQVVYSDNKGNLHKTTERLQAFEGVVSDTFGFAIGETDDAKTPLAVAGRVLVYPDEDKYTFHAGDVVCAGKFGTVSKMTREEIIAYPDRIVGIVSEIPEYETWGTGNVPVYSRIWIRVK